VLVAEPVQRAEVQALAVVSVRHAVVEVSDAALERRAGAAVKDGFPVPVAAFVVAAALCAAAAAWVAVAAACCAAAACCSERQGDCSVLALQDGCQAWACQDGLLS
jgi:hypothetical protein